MTARRDNVIVIIIIIIIIIIIVIDSLILFFRLSTFSFYHYDYAYAQSSQLSYSDSLLVNKIATQLSTGGLVSLASPGINFF